tara:strand:+ start:1567 stop:2376 length:810 start_codon:yes stop_codon:yes gene_type:complete
MSLLAIAATLTTMNTSSTLIQQTMTSIQSGVSVIGEALGKIWESMSSKAMEAVQKIENFWNEHLADIFGPWVETAREVLGGLWTFFSELFNKIAGAVAGIPDKFGEIRSGIEAEMASITNTIEGIPQRATDKINEILTKALPVINEVRAKISEFASDARGVLSSVGDAILAPFKALWDIVQKVKDALVGGIMSLADKVFGGGGSTTNNAVNAAGTMVAGGVSQTFNMTFDVSGVTDFTDKERLADEISVKVQEKFALLGGGTMSSGGVF